MRLSVSSQELYEKKLVTYPQNGRQSAFYGSIKGNLQEYLSDFAITPGRSELLRRRSPCRWEATRTIAKTRYVNDKQITDHYAIIPTGQGLGALRTV